MRKTPLFSIDPAAKADDIIMFIDGALYWVPGAPEDYEFMVNYERGDKA